MVAEMLAIIIVHRRNILRKQRKIWYSEIYCSSRGTQTQSILIKCIKLKINKLSFLRCKNSSEHSVISPTSDSGKQRARVC